MKSSVKLNANEQLVLRSLFDSFSECHDFYVMTFAGIIRGCRTRLERPQVRRACRSLARKGLAEYHRGCWTEDGRPAGAGYGITNNGVARMKELRAGKEPENVDF